MTLLKLDYAESTDVEDDFSLGNKKKRRDLLNLGGLASMKGKSDNMAGLPTDFYRKEEYGGSVGRS